MRMLLRRLRRQTNLFHRLQVPDHFTSEVKAVRSYVRRNKDAVNEPDLDRFNALYFVRENANCLAFLLDVQRFVTPAEKLDNATHTGEVLVERRDDPFEELLQREGGFSPVLPGPLRRPSSSAILVAAMKGTEGTRFHFLLYGGGRWYHKPGDLPATDRDVAGKVITDPTTAAYHHSYELVGFFWLEREDSSSYRIMREQNQIDVVIDKEYW